LYTLASAIEYPLNLIFDPNQEPGPDQACPNGIPKFGGTLPFEQGTAVNHPDIVNWLEREIECVWGNYFNNVNYTSYDVLMQNIATENTEDCIQPSDGNERCYNEEQMKQRFRLIRQILDVTQVVASVTEVNDYTIKIVSNASCTLQVVIPGTNYMVGHSFQEYIVGTTTFNADGTIRKRTAWTEDHIDGTLVEWAETVLSGYSDYFVIDHENDHEGKNNFYRLDFKDTSTKIIILSLIVWIICAPMVMVFIAFKCCYKRKNHQYEKVGIVSASDSADDLNSEPH